MYFVNNEKRKKERRWTITNKHCVFICKDKMLYNLFTAGQVSESRLKEIQDEMSKEQQRVDGLTNKYVAQMREKNVSTDKLR